MNRWIWIAGGALLAAAAAAAGKKGAAAAPRAAGVLVAGPGYTPAGGEYLYQRETHVHQGIDIYADEGTAVLAPAPGRVSYSASIPGYGETVIVRLETGWRYLCAHLDSRAAAVGDNVVTGELLGTVGRTADGACGRYFCSDAAHLHFEALPVAGAVNPSLQRADPRAFLYAWGILPSVGQSQA